MSQAFTIAGLELAERMAEGTAAESEGEGFLADFGVTSPAGAPGPQEAARIVPFVAIQVMLPHRIGRSSETQAASAAQSCAGVYYARNEPLRAVQEISAQTDLLREIIGNPFRPVAVDSAWLTSDVVALATGIYAEKAFDRMPILADALQDAGCENEDILTHCRGPGPHVRGCWVVDRLLGKE
jgi:hypothetical protein